MNLLDIFLMVEVLVEEIIIKKIKIMIKIEDLMDFGISPKVLQIHF